MPVDDEFGRRRDHCAGSCGRPPPDADAYYRTLPQLFPAQFSHVGVHSVPRGRDGCRTSCCDHAPAAGWQSPVRHKRRILYRFTTCNDSSGLKRPHITESLLRLLHTVQVAILNIDHLSARVRVLATLSCAGCSALRFSWLPPLGTRSSASQRHSDGVTGHKRR